MLKYASIIEKLTLRQKIALVTDSGSLSDGEINRLGVPCVELSTLAELNARGEGPLFPSFAALAHSWDVSLFAGIAERLARSARGQGASLIRTPDLKSGIDPYAGRLSEDPVLCGEYGRGTLGGIHRAGAAACLARYCLDEGDESFLDVEENETAVREFYTYPFELACREEKAEAIRASLGQRAGNYDGSNAKLVRGAVKEGFVFLEEASCDADLKALLKERCCLEGGALALDAALGRFRALSALVEEGSATERELEEAVARSEAIAEDRLDEAVDRVIGFAFLCAERTAQEEEDGTEDLLLRAAQESVVLLKNEGVLPLARGTRVALIGAAATEGAENFVKELTIGAGEYGLQYIGKADGYSLSAERSEELIPDAVKLAEEADVVLFFPGGGGERGELGLPANRLALADALSRTGRPVVAVLSGDADMSFDKNLQATLLAPLSGSFACDALLGVLSGRYNPSGRLARTLYDNTDELFRVQKRYKDEGRNRVGTFAGYRRYDTAGRAPRYPFGSGLGYSPFVYSGLEIGENAVRLTVTNRGKYAGRETVQLYAGRKKGVRPKKELKAFAQVDLLPGESKPVELSLPPELFTYYSERTRRREPDGGVYTLYVGHSVEDIRLKGLLRVPAPEREEREEALSDYLQSVSDLLYRGYPLPAARKYAARGEKRRRAVRKTALFLLATAIAADLMLFAVLFAGLSPALRLAPGLAVVNVFLFVSLVMLLAERSTRRRGRPDGEKETYADGETASSGTPESFFLSLLQETEELPEEREEKERARYFDEKFSFADACGELALFLAERGVALTADEARLLVAAVASQSCIVLRGPVKPLVSLAGGLGEYFGTTLFSDMTDGYRERDDLYLKEGSRGVRVKTNTYRAILAAEEMKPYLHFALLNHVRPSALAGYFGDVAAFLRDPRGTVDLPSERGRASSRPLPSNLKFLLVLAEGQSLTDLPAAVADVAAVLPLEPRLVPPKEEKTLVRPMGAYQISEMARAAKLSFMLGEESFKKVDRLEGELRARAPYKIDNRLFLSLESFASVYLACGGGAAECLDGTVAAKLLSRASSVAGRELPVLIREIFPEAPRCGKLMKYMRADRLDADVEEES